VGVQRLDVEADLTRKLALGGVGEVRSSEVQGRGGWAISQARQLSRLGWLCGRLLKWLSGWLLKPPTNPTRKTPTYPNPTARHQTPNRPTPKPPNPNP